MALTASTASGKKMKGECHRESSAVPPGTPRRTPLATPRGAVDPAVARPGRKHVATARLIFNTIFFLPLTAWSLASKTRASVATICCTTTAGARYFHCLPPLCAPFPKCQTETAVRMWQFGGELLVRYTRVHGDQKAF